MNTSAVMEPTVPPGTTTARSTSNRQMLYLIGAPGAGKTTVLYKTLKLDKIFLDDSGPYCGYLRRVGSTEIVGYQLGHQRESFGGTDALAMDSQPKVLAWLDLLPDYAAVVGEGDRLANDSFFAAVKKLGYKLTVAHVDTPPALLKKRRDERSQRLGIGPQNATWVRGRETKVSKMADKWASLAWRLDGRKSVDELAARLQQHPVIKQIRGEVSA